MVQLKFVDQNNNGIGVISWFAIHPTSMNNTNKLISSDNVGYAAVLFEQNMNTKLNLIGKVKHPHFFYALIFESICLF